MLKLFRNFTKRDYLFIGISVIFIVIQVWLELKMPDYMSTITRLVETEGSKMADILRNGGYMLACAFGSMLSSVIVGYLIANIAAHFSYNLREKVYDKVEHLSTSEVKQFKTSSLITRTTNDITQITMFISIGMQMLIKSPITAIWAITKILNKSWQWSAVTAVAVVVLLSMVIMVMRTVVPRFKIIQKLIDKINGLMRENLTGIRVVRAFNAEKYQEKKFDKTNDELTNIQISNQKMFANFSPVMYLTMYFLSLSIYFIGAYLIKDAMMAEKLTIFGDMIVFSSYAMQIIMSFLMLAVIFMMLPRAQVSAERINEVLDAKSSIISGNYKKDNGVRGEVEFKNVSFKYPDAEECILENISFKANKGETIAFIGSTGSGKSTLINLIPRFYDATSGEILIDGVDVKKYDLKYLYDKIGYVPQKPVLFSGNVSSNIGFGDREYKDEEIKTAAKVAEADEFIEKMDDKYKEHIAQGGTNISGGQKQRMSIARAVAKNPEIYIFDDAFSALDYKTDATLRKNLKEYTKDATIFIVAQRIGTIMNADKIVVLDKGKCVGIGKHKDLLKSCDVYKQIALSQLSEEELANA